MDLDRAAPRSARRRPREEPRAPRHTAIWAVPWLVGQVLLALAAQQLQRPVRRPARRDLLLWPATLLVAIAFLIPLGNVSLPLAGLAGAILLVIAWRGWH